MSIIRVRFASLSVLVCSLALIASPCNRAFAQRGGGGGREAGTPPQYFFGMAHTTLGGATLATDPVGRLVIANIGSSGQDGVSVAISQPSPAGGVAPGWGGVVDFGPAGALPIGASVVVQARDQFGNAVCSLNIFETDGGNPGAHGQAGVGVTSNMFPATSVTVETRLHGVVVQTAQFAPPFPPMLASGAIGFNGGNGVEVRTQNSRILVNGLVVGVCEDSVILPSPALIRLNGGLPPADADEVSIRLNGLPPGTRYIGNLSVTAANTGPITVETEGLLKTAAKGTVKWFNEAKGFGRIIGGGDLDGDGIPDIVVSNIGSSGNDGVSLLRFRASTPGTIESTAAVSVEADWGHAGALPTGSTMRFVIGNDAPVVRTYTLSVSETGGGLGAVSVIPCNEPGCCQPCCPCAGVVVEAVRNGTLVDRVLHATLPAGGLVAVGNIGSSGQDGVTFFATLLDSCLNVLDDRYLLGLRTGGAAGPMTLTGSSIGTVTADTVRVRITPADDLGSLGSPRLLASNVNQFVVLNGEERREFINDLTHEGLPHDALGAATLAITADGKLQVSNIGSSGQDGVAIDLGDAQGVSVDVDFGPAGGLPAGRSFTLRDRNITNSTCTPRGVAGGSAAISFQSDICPTCPLHVDVLNNGHVVRSATYPPPYPPQLVVGNIGSSGQDGVRFEWDAAADLGGGVRGLSLCIHNPLVVPLTIPGTPPVNGDAVRLSLNGLPPGTPVDGLRILDLTADGIPDVVVARQRILALENVMTALGNAHPCAARDNHLQGGVDVIQTLRIANIGSSGQDGVSIEPPDEDCDGEAERASSVSVTLDPLPLPPGAEHAIKTKGTGTSGLAGTSALEASLNLQRVGGDVLIHGDFSALGSSTCTAEIYLNGQLVFSAAGQNPSPLGSVPGASQLRKEQSDLRTLLGSANTRLQMTLAWTSPVAITLSSGSGAVGNELRIFNDSPSMSAHGITSMELTASNLTGGAFTMTAAHSAVINTCPADIIVPHNGNVDVDDLLAVITHWGPCPAPCPPHCLGDIAPPGGNCAVNVDDLLTVITHWGACP